MKVVSANVSASHTSARGGDGPTAKGRIARRDPMRACRWRLLAWCLALPRACAGRNFTIRSAGRNFTFRAKPPSLPRWLPSSTVAAIEQLDAALVPRTRGVPPRPKDYGVVLEELARLRRLAPPAATRMSSNHPLRFRPSESAPCGPLGAEVRCHPRRALCRRALPWPAHRSPCAGTLLRGHPLQRSRGPLHGHPRRVWHRLQRAVLPRLG